MLRSSPLHRGQHLDTCPVRDGKVAPAGPRHNLAVDRHRDAARVGLKVEYSQKTGNGLLAGIVVRSAVEVDHEEEMGSCLVSSPSNERVTSSAVSGASRMPLRWWPVAHVNPSSAPGPITGALSGVPGRYPTPSSSIRSSLIPGTSSCPSRNSSYTPPAVA